MMSARRSRPSFGRESLDHTFLTVGDTDRSIAFYERVLPVLGITARSDFVGKDGPPGHPDLMGFGAKGRMFGFGMARLHRARCMSV